MANTYKLLGNVEKIVDGRGRSRGFGVLVEITFPDGRQKEHLYQSRKKKDLLADMQNGKMASWINCARIDAQSGNLVFQLELC